MQGLQKSAGLDRLVRQTELISHIESMLFSRLLHCLPKKMLTVLHQEALVVPHGYSWSSTIRPNDLREDRLPRDITEGVHWLVSMRYTMFSTSYEIRIEVTIFKAHNISRLSYFCLFINFTDIGPERDDHSVDMLVDGE